MFLLTNISFELKKYVLSYFLSIATYSVSISKKKKYDCHLLFFALKSLFWFQIYFIWLSNKGAKFSS